MSKFAQAIFNKLFLPDGKKFVVARNRDGLLWLQGCCTALAGYGVQVFHGKSLALRITWETVVKQNPDKLILFVLTGDFEILPDIAMGCDVVNFQFRSFFSHYPWDTVKQLSFEQQEWLFEQKGIVDLDSLVRKDVVCDVASEKAHSQRAYDDLVSEWDHICVDIAFNRPTEWMLKAGGIVLSVIELGKWNDFQSRIAGVNERFLEFLKAGYINIVSSTCGTKYPRIVTQVLPFIYRQPEEKTALVVIDGMNWWQSLMLTRCLEDKLNVRANFDCIFAWLPSVTELSRQAIFRGDIPSVDYVQSPANEKKLWKEFWQGKGVALFEQYYQHSGMLDEEASVKRLGYVAVELDNMMHSSANYKYLYSNTKNWIDEEEIVANIRHLLDGGYKVFIITDHGNIDTTAYKKLDQRDKLGADLSLRHITLPDAADKGLFEAEYGEHFVQVDSDSKTYYARGKEAFMNSGKCVTHGGAHWLEVLIPFITLEK